MIAPHYGREYTNENENKKKMERKNTIHKLRYFTTSTIIIPVLESFFFVCSLHSQSYFFPSLFDKTLILFFVSFIFFFFVATSKYQISDDKIKNHFSSAMLQPIVDVRSMWRLNTKSNFSYISLNLRMKVNFF